MAGTIHKEDSRHPAHPDFNKVSRERAALEALQKKQADEKAAADKKAADEAAKKK